MSFALIFDGLSLCVLLFFCVRGMFKGFLSELIGLIGFFVSLYCAWNFHDLLAEIIMGWFPKLSPNVVILICGAAIFLGLSLIFALIGYGLSAALNLAGLSFIDHALGTVVGAVKTFAILIMIYGTCMVFSTIMPTSWLQESYAMRIVANVWPPVLSFLQKHNLVNTNDIAVTTFNKTPTPPSATSSGAPTSESHTATNVILAVPDTAAGELGERDLK